MFTFVSLNRFVANKQTNGTMRFNKQELITLATQPSTKFEKEGVLYIRERQEGFFRKSESEYSPPT